MKIYALLLALLSFEVVASECDQDAKKFCAGIDPGKGQLARCLSDYSSELSKSCSEELKKYKVETAKKNPCFEDLAEYCSDIPSDPRNYEYCLLKNESRLGQKCSEDFKKKKGNILVKNQCAQDIVNNCFKEISGPEGSINRCLIRNKTKLSKFCQNNMDKKISQMRKKNPCFDDTEKFCPTQVKFIDIQDCLSKKVSTLAPSCKVLVEKESQKMKANPCYRDLVTHCVPGLGPKEQNECLALNEEHISNSCKQFRFQEAGKIKKMVDVCEQDRLKLCKDAPFKDGAVIKCLRSKKEKVSPDCRKFL